MIPDVATGHAPTTIGLQRLLEAARRQLGMDVVLLTRFAAPHRSVEAVAGDHPSVAVGRSDPLDDTFCQRLVDGRLPAVVPDARQHPASARLPCTAELDIGAHVGVPVVLRDGRLFGTLCSFRSAPHPGLTQQDAGLLRVIAEAVAELVEDAHGRRGEHDRLRAELQALLDRDEPRIAVQPIRRLSDGTIVAVEALSRFDSAPERSPVDVFAQAEQVGLGLDLELAALTAVCAVVPQSPVPVSVNGSAQLWLHPEALPALERCGLDRVVVELTERHAVASYPQLNAALAPYRRRGLRVAVDDTGAGWAGLQHVLALEPDLLKLDVALIRGIDRSSRQQAMVAALAAFASRTQAQVVAEGVETHAEVDVLLDLGVELGQGFLLGRPVPPAAA